MNLETIQDLSLSVTPTQLMTLKDSATNESCPVDVKEEFNEVEEFSDEENSAPDSPAPRKRKAKEEKSDSETDTPKPKWPKKLPKEERWKTYKQYTEDDLRQALEDVMDKKMNQKQAATHYHVPRKTLNDESSVRPLTPTSEVDDPQDNSQDNEDAMLIIKKHRDNIRSVLAYSNATPIRGYWGEGYVCAFCPQQFPEASALQTHTRSHGNISKLYKVHHVRNHVVRLDVTGLKCNICDNKIKDLQSLMHHLKQHKKPMHFDIKNHMIPFKFDAEELECIECSKNFNHFKSLSEHMANVHYRNFVCTRCERGFVNKVNLVAHKDTHKTGKFWCNFCGNLYDTRRKKTTHERLKHSLQTKSVKCGYCKMRFQSINQKNNHELRAHMKQQTAYSCNSCEKSYARQRSLRDHINKDHLLQRPYKCPQKLCKKAFYLKKTLQAHILTHGDAKPFPCAECSKEYRSEKALKEHMYTHNDRKEFKCNKCSKSYESKLVVGEQHGTERALTPTKDELTGAGFKALLTKHRENIHSVLAYSNATPIRCYSGMGYACVFCAHQHRDPAALKRHTRTEHITENYKIKHLRSHLVKLDVTGLKCSICNTKFVALESFMRHLKSKHDKPMHFDIKNHIVPYKFDKIDLECVKCGKLFNNFKNISEHMNNIHFRNYECDKCPRGFVNKNTLMTHGSNHKTGEFPCDYCRKIFRTHLRKREHERTLHIHNSKTRKCGYCPEKFIDVAHKINHEVLVHKAERQEFSCTECKGKFTSPRLLCHHKKKQHHV
ncbi:Uncharacterized protein OBRU01_16821 [Operophtera brumata]|uniref:C2H2-type domain-containing protein n=1 Tax=Operophtera brumata TaxID=104452 RepID=A0A0L7L256_OPEBR|nr:Uncharacterized protein OBRU01_16821 [Operophtera brumata]